MTCVSSTVNRVQVLCSFSVGLHNEPNKSLFQCSFFCKSGSGSSVQQHCSVINSLEATTGLNGPTYHKSYTSVHLT